MVDLIGDKNIPVIAAGAIVDARGYVAALALGAQAVCLGTRFIFNFNYLNNNNKSNADSNLHDLPADLWRLMKAMHTLYTSRS